MVPGMSKYYSRKIKTTEIMCLQNRTQKICTTNVKPSSASQIWKRYSNRNHLPHTNQKHQHRKTFADSTTTTTSDNHDSSPVRNILWDVSHGNHHRSKVLRQTNLIWLAALAVIFLLSSSLIVVVVEACNESICASIVSKCTLLRSCDCDLEPTGCSCCKKCYACLDFLQVECCSCVGLCPSPNATLSTTAPQKSVVADFEEPVPQLWDALTEGEDMQGRWTKFTYPMEVKAPPTPKKTLDDLPDPNSVQDLPPRSSESSPSKTLNCTVVFLSQCMAEKKCESSCRSMGASAYRWFADGCCECVGGSCLSYGINESRCELCSYDDDDDQLSPDNMTDEELERLERQEAMGATNEEILTPDEAHRSTSTKKPPPKKVPEES